jgi:hypothetical protein
MPPVTRRQATPCLVKERRVPGRKSLTNIVRIVSPEWSAWIGRKIAHATDNQVFLSNRRLGQRDQNRVIRFSAAVAKDNKDISARCLL